MILPEYPSASNREQLQTAINDVQHRLEINDENENQIERTTRRDRLLEQQDELLEALTSLDATTPLLPLDPAS